MHGRLAYVALALSGGMLLAVQAPINARLRTALDSPFASAVVSFSVGLTLLVAALLATGQAGRLTAVGGGPWWAYLGGFMGAFFIMVGILAAPRVGVTVTFVAVIAGQIVMAAVIDRFGWFGLPAIAVTWERVTAIALVVVAVGLLVRR